MEQNPIIQCQGLTKRYRRVNAVENLTFEVRQGEIFGFLGPNGAGKTTTLLMLLGLSRPPRAVPRCAGLTLCVTPWR